MIRMPTAPAQTAAPRQTARELDRGGEQAPRFELPQAAADDDRHGAEHLELGRDASEAARPEGPRALWRGEGEQAARRPDDDPGEGAAALAATVTTAPLEAAIVAKGGVPEETTVGGAPVRTPTGEDLGATTATTGTIAVRAVAEEPVTVGAVAAEPVTVGAVAADAVAEEPVTVGAVAADAVAAEPVTVGAVAGKPVAAGAVAAGAATPPDAPDAPDVLARGIADKAAAAAGDAVDDEGQGSLGGGQRSVRALRIEAAEGRRYREIAARQAQAQAARASARTQAAGAEGGARAPTQLAAVTSALAAQLAEEGGGDELTPPDRARVDLGAEIATQAQPRAGEAARRVTATTAARAIADDVQDALRQMVDTPRDGETLLRLEHEAFGRFSALVRVEGGDLLVQLRAADPALRALLDDGAGSLREELAGAGLVAGDVEVDVGGRGQGDGESPGDDDGASLAGGRDAWQARRRRALHAHPITREARRPGASRLDVIA